MEVQSCPCLELQIGFSVLGLLNLNLQFAINQLLLQFLINS